MQCRKIFTLAFSLALICCNCTQVDSEMTEAPPDNIKVAKLRGAPSANFDALRESFSSRNPGYDVQYFADTQTLGLSEKHRILFIQDGSGTVTLSGGNSSKFTIGEIILLNPSVSLSTDSAMSVVAFTVPEAFPEDLPVFIRPDWDENITDTPGGCATETNAYRRILLTWMKKVGPYQYHALNAHRVRIMDSFTHYHPKDGGFDEFYLVQMAQPGARLITSNKLSLILEPDQVTKEQVSDLLQVTPLEVGDLIYIPRGVIHRGVDGVLAQVITVPGFIPGSEIGVDHYLKAINERLELDDAESLPFNEGASAEAIIK